MRTLGVDLGGSRLRAALRTGKRVRRVARARPEAGELLKVLKSIAGEEKLDALVIGARGVWTKAERKALALHLKPLAREIKVLSDIELAWHAALGEGAGVVITAGTGAVAYARGLNGRAARAGGLGPLLGDEGSAFWIGREWLKTRSDAAQRRFAVRPDAVAAIAAAAPRALREKPILAAQAAAHLRRITQRAAALAGLRGPVRVSWQGGLFSNKTLYRRFESLLPRRFTLQPPRCTPVEAAVKLLP